MLCVKENELGFVNGWLLGFADGIPVVNWDIDGIGVWTWLNVPLMGMEGIEALVGVGM